MLIPFLHPTVFPILLAIVYAFWWAGDRFDGCCPASNWEQRYSLHSSLVVRPESLKSITEALRLARAYNKRVTLLGSGHSWSDIAQPVETGNPRSQDDTDSQTDKFNGTLTLCMRCFSGLVGVDKTKSEITVLGGTTLAQIIDILAENDLALDVFPSISDQTIAGALATGTHGTGPTHGNLATIVKSIELVTADGQVRTVSRDIDPDIFHAATVGLGMFGVVTKVTLQASAKFNLFERKVLITDDELYENFEGIITGDEYVKIWKEECSGMNLVYSSSRSQEQPQGNKARWFSDLRMCIFEAIIYLASFYPPVIPKTMHFLVHYADALPVGERVSVWHDVFNIPHHVPLHPESEFAVPLDRAAEALQLLSKHLKKNSVGSNLAVEVRFVAADEFWLSNEYNTSTCHITTLLYGQDPTFMKHMMTEYGEEVRKMGGRPHWGKMFNTTESLLKPLYPKWDAAVALKRKLDPSGMFCNTLVKRVFTDSHIC